MIPRLTQSGRAKIYYFGETSASVDVMSVNTIIMSVNTISVMSVNTIIRYKLESRRQLETGEIRKYIRRSLYNSGERHKSSNFGITMNRSRRECTCMVSLIKT